MSRYYLVAHGINETNRQKVRVPIGLKLHFYAGQQQSISGAVAWEILHNKDNVGVPVLGGEYTENVALAALERKIFINEVKHSRRYGDKVICAGEKLKEADATVTEGRFCNDPALCAGKDLHVCGGTFQQLTDMKITEVHLVVCLGDASEATLSTEAGYAGTGRETIDEKTSSLMETWQSLMDLDPRKATDWFNKSLSVEERDVLIADYLDIMEWRSIQKESNLALGLEVDEYFRRFLNLPADKRNLIMARSSSLEKGNGVWWRAATATIRQKVAFAQQRFNELGMSRPKAFLATFFALSRTAQEAELELLFNYNDRLVSEYLRLPDDRLKKVLLTHLRKQDMEVRRQRAKAGPADEKSTSLGSELFFSMPPGKPVDLASAKKANFTSDRTVLSSTDFKEKLVAALAAQSAAASTSPSRSSDRSRITPVQTNLLRKMDDKAAKYLQQAGRATGEHARNLHSKAEAAVLAAIAKWFVLQGRDGRSADIYICDYADNISAFVALYESQLNAPCKTAQFKKNQIH